MDITTAIMAVINTLDKVTVVGIDSQRGLVNSVDTLQNIISAIEKARKEPPAEEVVENG